MAQTITLSNFSSLNILNRTTLTANIAAGVNSLPIENTNGFAANNLIIIGDLGTDASEKLEIASLSSSASVQTTAASILQHYQYDAVTSLFR